jgi:hypothetical protein
MTRIQILISGPKLLATGLTGYHENQKKTGANLNFANKLNENRLVTPVLPVYRY